jgi:hypothetical protein
MGTGRRPPAPEAVLGWLSRGDPAIRWQTGRDLLGWPVKRWRDEQARVATEGWGARLLARQDGTGRWTRRLYGQKWISTTYSMLLLRQLGLPGHDPRALKSCRLFLDEGLWHDGGFNPSAPERRSETCVTGIVLNLLSWFKVADPRREQLVAYLLREQLDDGGWNCRRRGGDTHGSFHTTINVLEGLRAYVEGKGARAEDARRAEARGREFFLRHHLYRSHRTGRIVQSAFTRFSFPPGWRHDVLRTLDYFRASRAAYDERLEDPLGVVVKRRTREGYWVLQNRHPGKSFFELETVGRPSRWNTLRALRVLHWYDGARTG